MRNFRFTFCSSSLPYTLFWTVDAHLMYITSAARTQKASFYTPEFRLFSIGNVKNVNNCMTCKKFEPSKMVKRHKKSEFEGNRESVKMKTHIQSFSSSCSIPPPPQHSQRENLEKIHHKTLWNFLMIFRNCFSRSDIYSHNPPLWPMLRDKRNLYVFCFSKSPEKGLTGK